MKIAYSLFIILVAMFCMSASQVVPLGQVVTNPLPIPSGQPTGGPITTNGMSPVGILFPASLTSTTMTFTVATTLAGTYMPLYNASGAVSYTIAASRYVAINPADFYGVQFIKVILGSDEAAARTITVSMKGI